MNMNQRVLNKIKGAKEHNISGLKVHIYCVHLASVRFEHSVCRRSLMITCVYIYIYIHGIHFELRFFDST